MTKCLVIGLAVAALLVPLAAHADFDRDQCYSKCRGVPLRFGSFQEEVRPCHLAQGNYDACIQECERQFWAEFEKRANGPKERDE
jgi:hypothetical protein